MTCTEDAPVEQPAIKLFECIDREFSHSLEGGYPECTYIVPTVYSHQDDTKHGHSELAQQTKNLKILRHGVSQEDSVRAEAAHL